MKKGSKEKEKENQPAITDSREVGLEELEVELEFESTAVTVVDCASALSAWPIFWFLFFLSNQDSMSSFNTLFSSFDAISSTYS